MITKDAIENFCKQCSFIRVLYKEFVYLYEDNQERLDLLNKTARDFFLEFEVILRDRIYLDICKITDSSRGNKNLTIKYILKEMEQDVKDKLGLDALSDEIHNFSKKYISPARHKIIAHNDYETTMHNKTLGEFPESECDKFWSNLQEFVNRIFNHYFNIPYVLDRAGCSYKVERLVQALKKAAYFDQHFENVFRSKLLEEKTFKYKNA